MCVFMPQLESCPFRALLNKIPAEQNDGDGVDRRPLRPFFLFGTSSRVWCIYRAATGVLKGHFILLIKSWNTKTADETKKHTHPAFFFKFLPPSPHWEKCRLRSSELFRRNRIGTEGFTDVCTLMDGSIQYEWRLLFRIRERKGWWREKKIKKK